MKICDKSCYQHSACKWVHLTTLHGNTVRVRCKVVLWKTLQKCCISFLYRMNQNNFSSPVYCCWFTHGLGGEMPILIHSGFTVMNYLVKLISSFKSGYVSKVANTRRKCNWWVLSILKWDFVDLLANRHLPLLYKWVSPNITWHCCTLSHLKHMTTETDNINSTWRNILQVKFIFVIFFVDWLKA